MGLRTVVLWLYCTARLYSTNLDGTGSTCPSHVAHRKHKLSIMIIMYILQTELPRLP